MSNPWTNLVTTKEALEKEHGRLEARLEEVVLDIPTARANVKASHPTKDEAERVLRSLETERDDLVKKISETDDALKQLATAPKKSGNASSTGTTVTQKGEDEGMIHRAVHVVGVVAVIIILSLLAIFAATGFGSWWGENKAAVQEAIDDLLPDFGCVGIGCPSTGTPAPSEARSVTPIVIPSPEPTLPPRATPEPTAAPTAVVTPAPAPTPSAKPDFPGVCSALPGSDGIKLDGTQRNLTSIYNNGSWIHLQFYTKSGEPERDTLIPASEANRMFKSDVLVFGTVWYYNPTCTQEQAQADVDKAVVIRGADPTVQSNGFVAWEVSGIYN